LWPGSYSPLPALAAIKRTKKKPTSAVVRRGDDAGFKPYGDMAMVIV
jgi:hypothetical protein